MAEREAINQRPPADLDGVSRTGPQSGRGRPATIAGVPLAIADPRTPGLTHPTISVLAADSETPGIPPAPAGTYDVYRQIRSDPTVALARAVVHGPILASNWSFVKAAEDVPDEWRDFVREVYDPMQASLKSQLLYALDYGCRSFEQVYGVRAFGGRERVVLAKAKPLRPDNTEVLVDRGTGAYAGLRNGDVDLLPEETLHFAYDNEDDDWYGRSRLENVRDEAWWPHKYFVQTAAKLGRKVSNIMPVVKGPISAEEFDKDGRLVTGYDVGMTILNALVQGDGVMVENLAAAVNDLVGNPELAKQSKWNIDSYDTGSSATAVPGLIEILRYYDALKMRGMLRPERTATEGQHGTKAEAGEHAQVGLAEGQQLHLLICQLVSWHSADRLLVWNFGERARGQVFIEPAPLIDEKRAIFRWLFEALLANPAIIDVLASRLDIDAMADQLGVPKTEPLDLQDDDAVPAGPPRPPPPPNQMSRSNLRKFLVTRGLLRTGRELRPPKKGRRAAPPSRRPNR